MLHRGSANQHAKPHLVPVRQSHFDRPNFVTHLQRRQNDESLFPIAAGVHDPAIVDGLGNTGSANLVVALQRVHVELNERYASSLQRPDVECVKGGTAGARVQLCLDPLDAKLGQPDPFAPSGDLRLVNWLDWLGRNLGEAFPRFRERLFGHFLCCARFWARCLHLHWT